MKKSILLFILFFTSFFSFAQEFMQPDSAAIIKNHVKSVKIYYTGTGSKHYLTQEYGYDKNGRKVYSHEGNANYYYSFSYNEKGFATGTFQRNTSGNLIQGQKMDYYPGGKLFHREVTFDRDTIHPSSIYTYDTVGNRIEENEYVNGKFNRSWKYGYDLNKQVIRQIDSTPGKNTYESVNSKTIRQTYYNENNMLLENWIISYNNNGNLIRTICTSGKKTDSYSIVYEDQSEIEYHVLKNGKTITQEEYVMWDSKFRWLMPQPQDGDIRLPYSDPVPKYDYEHGLKRDSKGNVIKDIVSGAYPYMNFEPVQYDYEYEYW